MLTKAVRWLSLIGDLSSLRRFRVISRTSAMRLKETGKDIQTIGVELGVRYAIEGTVRRAGPNLRITAQLIDTKRDAQIWTEKIDGVLNDVFQMQEDLSRSIVEKLARGLRGTVVFGALLEDLESAWSDFKSYSDRVLW